jgi:DNA-directed RNA polymerase subunit N (RpoN/RPB10)
MSWKWKEVDWTFPIRCECFTCGAEYFISSYAKIADTGRCVSCDNEIAELERLYGGVQ